MNFPMLLAKPLLGFFVLLGLPAVPAERFFNNAISSQTENRIEAVVKKETPVAATTTSVSIQKPTSTPEVKVSTPKIQEASKEVVAKPAPVVPKDIPLSYLESLIQKLTALKKEKDVSRAVVLLGDYEKEIDLLQKSIPVSGLSQAANAAFFKNYALFVEVEKGYQGKQETKELFSSIKKKLNAEIKNQAEAASGKVLKASQKSSRAPFQWLFAAIIGSEAALGEVIHTRAIADPYDPGESWGDPRSRECWKHETWINLSSGKIRQEGSYYTSFQMPGGGEGCWTEIDLTDTRTGEKLSLDPLNKYAEWIHGKSGKFGISEESISTTYEKYTKLLDDPRTLIEGTLHAYDKDLYVIKTYVYDEDSELREDYFTRYYVDAATYFIYKIDSYFSGVKHYSTIYEVTEIIPPSALPEGFFDLVIPEGYIEEEFVPFG